MAVFGGHSGASPPWDAVSNGHSMRDTLKWALPSPCPALGDTVPVRGVSSLHTDDKDTAADDCKPFLLLLLK